MYFVMSQNERVPFPVIHSAISRKHLSSFSFFGSCLAVLALQLPIPFRSNVNLIGLSPSGKAQDFDSCIRWFKSNWPSCSSSTLKSKFKMKEGFIITKITKHEMEYLVENGVPFGESGISHTVARHRRSYYMCGSRRNRQLLNHYRKVHTLIGNIDYNHAVRS